MLATMAQHLETLKMTLDTLGKSKIVDLSQALKALGEAEGRTQEETRVGILTLSRSLVGGRERRFVETMLGGTPDKSPKLLPVTTWTLGSAGAMPQTV